MKKIDEIRNSIKSLEESIEKTVAFFEASIDAMRQEIAFINQKVSDLESRLDKIEAWPHISEVHISEEDTKRHRKHREKRTSEEESVPSEAEIEETALPSRALHGTAPVSYERDVTPTRASAGMVRPPPPAPVPVTARQPRAAPSFEAGGNEGRPRGGIVEEQFVRPSAFLRKMSELEASMPQSALDTAPQANLRLQISSVLESMREGRSPPAHSPVRSPVTMPPATARSYTATHTEEYTPPQSVPVQAQPAGGKTFKVPDNWLPDCSRAKYYNPKNLDKGVLKDMEKKTKEIFVR
ncbi:MAG: hypothetical protein QW566_05405 [Candidatus Jordarchaeales archaeon]